MSRATSAALVESPTRRRWSPRTKRSPSCALGLPGGNLGGASSLASASPARKRATSPSEKPMVPRSRSVPLRWTTRSPSLPGSKEPPLLLAAMFAAASVSSSQSTSRYAQGPSGACTQPTATVPCLSLSGCLVMGQLGSKRLTRWCPPTRCLVRTLTTMPLRSPNFSMDFLSDAFSSLVIRRGLPCHGVRSATVSCLRVMVSPCRAGPRGRRRGARSRPACCWARWCSRG